MSKFFEYAKEFDLQQYFDSEVEPDVRIQLHRLYQRTKETVARQRKIDLEVVLLIGCLEAQNAAVNLGLGKRETLARSMGLSESQYWKWAQAGRVFVAFPQFIELVTKGRTHVSHISIIAPKISQANADVFWKELPHRSERETRELVASVNRDGSRNKIDPLFDLRLKFTKAQIAILDRAREVLSATGRVPSQEETLIKALVVLLERRDPVAKAARAKKRALKARAEDPTSVPQAEEATSVPQADGKIEISQDDSSALGTPVIQYRMESDFFGRVSKQRERARAHAPTPAVPKPRGRKGIPAATVHAVWNRDGDSCTNVDSNGKRCHSRVGLQVDHIIPAFYGHNNRLSNLRILCRECNIAEAQRILGEKVMQRYRWIEKNGYAL